VTALADVLGFLEELAPLPLAEDWDNVGLLIGHRDRQVRRVLTCLTLTPDVAEEAIADRVELVVTHHPVLFRPAQRLTDETPEGGMLLDLIAAGVAVYSPHTAFDSAREGVNQSLAEALALHEIQPLRVSARQETGQADADPGSGRCGSLSQPVSLAEFCRHVKSSLAVQHLQYVGAEDRRIERVAIACGAAASFLPGAFLLRCDVLLTGEARFHACLEAEALKVALVLPGHYATERPAVEQLADRIGRRFDSLDCRPSARERDPVRWSAS
jgi:dinuclear metal center YbgI/SA1388 family protein